MKFVRFTGSTPYRGTQYSALLAFEDDTPESEILHHSRQYSLENGVFFEHLFHAEHPDKDHLERAFMRCDYLQTCIDLGKIEYLTREEFEIAFADEDD